MRREYRLTQIVKSYDPALFVKRGDDQTLYLIRRTKRWETIEFNGRLVMYSRPDHQMIFALTDDWTQGGRSVDWGIEPLMARVREIDSHRSSEIIDRLNEAQELREQAKETDLTNKSESFARDLRTAVKLDFKDYNVSSLDRTDIRKKLEKKEGK